MMDNDKEKENEEEKEYFADGLKAAEEFEINK
jgi:hypothetical protein